MYIYDHISLAAHISHIDGYVWRSLWRSFMLFSLAYNIFRPFALSSKPQTIWKLRPAESLEPPRSSIVFLFPPVIWKLSLCRIHGRKTPLILGMMDSKCLHIDRAIDKRGVNPASYCPRWTNDGSFWVGSMWKRLGVSYKAMGDLFCQKTPPQSRIIKGVTVTGGGITLNDNEEGKG